MGLNLDYISALSGHVHIHTELNFDQQINYNFLIGLRGTNQTIGDITAIITF